MSVAQESKHVADVDRVMELRDVLLELERPMPKLQGGEAADRVHLTRAQNAKVLNAKKKSRKVATHKQLRACT